MAKLKITQSRSVIGNSGKQRRTLQTLGLRGMHQTVTREDTPVVRGMIDKVRHLVTVEEVNA